MKSKKTRLNIKHLNIRGTLAVSNKENKQVALPGRPLISQKGNQRRRNITIDDFSYEYIKKIGLGNFSAGIRKLLTAIKGRKK